MQSINQWMYCRNVLTSIASTLTMLAIPMHVNQQQAYM